MRVLLFLAVIFGVAYVQTYHGSPKQARTSDRWDLPPIDLQQYAELAEDRASTPAVEDQMSRAESWLGLAPSPSAFQPPEPGMYASSWFGKNKNRSRVIGTDPVHGLIIFTITRSAARRRSSQFPTFAEVQRLYHAKEGQDTSTLARAEFEWRDGHLNVSNFELEYPPRFVDPRPAVEAHAWESITRFRLEGDGSLLAVDFDPAFAGTIARRYVRLEKP